MISAMLLLTVALLFYLPRFNTMNVYLFIYEHVQGPKEGSMTVTIRASNENAAKDYMETQLKNSCAFKLKSIHCTGLDTYA
jgi:hypothetical protein